VLGAEDRSKAVVVEQRELRSPGDIDRLPGAEHEVDDGAKALGPEWQRSERGRAPIMGVDALSHLAAAVEPMGIFQSGRSSGVF
jgi:hypothetical protein